MSTALEDRRADALAHLDRRAVLRYASMYTWGPNARRGELAYWEESDDTEGLSMTRVEREAFARQKG